MLAKLSISVITDDQVGAHSRRKLLKRHNIFSYVSTSSHHGARPRYQVHLLFRPWPHDHAHEALLAIL